MTIHRQVVRQAVEEIDNPEFIETLAICLRNMQSGFFEKYYIDWWIQKDARAGKYNLYDAYCFATLHSAYHSGQILVHSVNISEEPFPDKETDANQDALNKLPKPFSAKFWGGTQGADGFFKWDLPITMDQWFVDPKTDEEKMDNKVIKPFQVPLEVGFTSGEKSLVQIRTTGLARWCYGQSGIVIFVPYGKFSRFNIAARS